MSTARSRSRNKPSLGPTLRDYLLVGVTGGIGSGKSAVCAAFERMGRAVFSADAIARALTLEDPSVRQEILTTFGPAIVAPSGGLDRKALAAVVFSDPAARRRLNAIVHPRVFTALAGALASNSPDRLIPYAIIEAALIYESGMDALLDYVIVVDAPEEERIRRTIERDRCTREEVLARIASQMSVHTKRLRADFVFENVGAVAALEDRVSFLDILLTTLGGKRRND